MATLRAAPTQPESPWCLKRRGQGWNGTFDSNNPKHQVQQLHQRTDTDLPNECSWQWEEHQKCSASPEQVGAKLYCSGEGAMDNQGQGNTMSSQLTRDARESFRRCADIQLVCIASPMSKSLSQVVRNTVASCYWGCPNAEAVARKIAVNPCGRENLPQPIGQDWARQRLTVRKKEQGAWDISSNREVSQQSMNCTERCPSQTNMGVATLTERIRFRRFYPITEAGWGLEQIHCSVGLWKMNSWRKAS